MTELADRMFETGIGVVGSPLQIRSRPGDAEAFPLDRLPPRLARAIEAIVEIHQVPVALAAQSVLAACALVAQSRLNIEMPTREVVPCSLYLFTVATSGERKSSADKLALRPVYHREKELREHYEAVRQGYTIDRDAYDAAVKSAKGGRKSREEIKQAVEAVGSPPIPPAIPTLLAGDEPTMEGIFKLLDEAYPALGLFSDDGAAFLGGYAMETDRSVGTGAKLSQLWDGRPLKRIRGTDVVRILEGRRLSLHLMVQPGVASKLFGNKELRDQGMFARLLVAAPKSMKGTRLWKDPSPEAWAALGAYHDRLGGLLKVAFSRMDPMTRELEYETITLQADARADWIVFSDGLERQQGPGGALAEVSDIASKMAQHAIRLAAVVSYFEGGEQSLRTGISRAAMGVGIALGEFYLSEALRLFNVGLSDDISDRADMLIDFIRAEKLSVVGRRWLQQNGPQQAVKPAVLYQAALRLLTETDNLVQCEGKTEFVAREKTITERVAFTVIYPDDGPQ